MHYLQTEKPCRKRHWSISLAAQALQSTILRGNLL